MTGFKFQDIPKLEELVKKMSLLDCYRKASVAARDDIRSLMRSDVDQADPRIWISRASSTVRVVLIDDELARDLLDALAAYETRCDEALAKIELSVA